VSLIDCSGKDSKAASNSTPSLDNGQIQKSFDLIGLHLSESELDRLMFGNTISLESKSLSEIGSVFILSSAIAGVNSGKANTITFPDILKPVTEFACCSKIPIYSWNCDPFGKCCLYLTSVDNKPAVNACCEF